MRYYAGAIDKFFGSTIPVDRDGIVLTFREPIGVTALITPWNFPLNIGNWKTAPALAASNTVVLKPASLSPSPCCYAELGLEAGLPAGALNVVPGRAAPWATRSSSIRSSGRWGSRARPRSASRSRARPRGRSSASRSSSGEERHRVRRRDLEKAGRMAPFSVFENAGQDCCARSRLPSKRP